MMPADIAQGIAKDAQENLDGLDVVNVPTYGGSAPWYVGQTTEGLLGFSGDIKLMTRILKAAIQHRGFAFVEMLQACPTYNHFATHEYLLDRYFDANAEGHEPGNLP